MQIYRSKHFLARDFAQHGTITRTISEASQSAASEVITKVSSQMDGLTHAEATARLKRFGENTTIHSMKKTWFSHFISALNNPLNLLLIILAIISFATQDITSGIIIVTIVIIGMGIRFIQETKANKAAEELKNMVRTTAKVMREGKEHEILLAHVVVGDIVLLSAGDIVPADVRIIESKDLSVNQSPLTGEIMPVEKHAPPTKESKTGLFDLQNICFMSTAVESGTAKAVVVATGDNTYFGLLSQSALEQQPLTSFDKGIQKFTWLMIGFMLVMVPLVFVINAFTKHSLLEAFLFGLAIAVGLTPQMLPMIVSANLANGAVAMSKQKVIVKRLNSIQNFGAMDVLCTDKTGTLTEGRVILQKYIDVHGKEDLDVLNFAYLNSYHQTGLKSIMDHAVIKFMEGQEDNDKTKFQNYTKIDEIPFDFHRRRMSVVVEEKDGNRILVCKGAVEEMLAICTTIKSGEKQQTLTAAGRKEIQAVLTNINESGFRILAIAYKKTSPNHSSVYSAKDESALVLVGFVAFLDPAKESARTIVPELHEYGIAVKVLTGDNELVTAKIAQDVNIPTEHILLGSQIEGMSDEMLAKCVEKTTIFAKLLPLHKERIIRALQKNGHVVGFLGDGINDAPALKVADIGISVDSAVDIAKESSDLILLERSLSVLKEGVLEGRKVFGNIMKYIRMAASSNFGNMASVMGASIFLPFLPMTPLQVIANNLLYDLSQTAIPTDNVDSRWLEKPRKWDVQSIKNYIFIIGPVSSFFDYVIFAFLIFFFDAWYHPALFQTGWFVASILTQILIIHIIRTDRIPFVQNRPSTLLVLSSLATIGIGVWLPFSPLAHALGLVPLPALFWVFMAATMVSYVIVTQVVKNWYIRHYQNI